jgi:hypothetical protein
MQEDQPQCIRTFDKRKTPNGLRLSGDVGEADGIHCSRGLGGGAYELIMTVW